VLLKSAEPEGIALARPPENVPVKEILDIVSDANIREVKKDGPVADVLMRRDQAVHKALEGTTLKTLAAESQGKTLRFAQAHGR
jgi:hypothetical protein